MTTAIAAGPEPRNERQLSPRQARRAARIPLLIFGGCGALFLALGARKVVQMERRLWTAQPVEAVVLETALRDTSAKGGAFRPVVRHRYVVGARTHESELVHPLPERLPGREAQALVARYQPGQVVTTNVPTAEPGAAYLVPARTWSHYGAMLFGLLFICFGLLGRYAVNYAARTGTVTVLDPQPSGAPGSPYGPTSGPDAGGPVRRGGRAGRRWAAALFTLVLLAFAAAQVVPDAVLRQHGLVMSGDVPARLDAILSPIADALPAIGSVLLQLGSALGSAARVVMFLIGPGLIAVWWRARQMELRSTQWQTVPGTVRSAQLVERIWRSSRRGRTPGYRAEITYEYSVRGRKLTAANVTTFDAAFFGWKIHTPDRAAAEAVLQRYPVSATVQVHHDPRRPELACLEPGPSGDARALLVVGIIFVIGTFVVLA